MITSTLKLMISLNRNRRRLWKSSDGSFTVEASFVLPIVLLVTAMLLFLCLYVYQKSFLVQASSAASERTAFIWDNSKKDAHTGRMAEGNYDPLYWRLTDDRLLASLFSLGSESSSPTITIPNTASDSDLPFVKMTKGAESVPDGMEGEMKYDNKVLLRKVSTTLSWPASIAPLEKVISGGADLEVSSHSFIADPVEFIRTVELMRYYGSKFKRADGNRTDAGTASEVLQRYGGR
ncbi:TadE family protein [Paenibacillus dakarensis]|uniref:TadE family protein n=1 Tax=Paenibacillus dakarensis TaxID=1527293 RepID=UPI001FE08D76|nr:TadE family protein [Paenibacillus dakarensis]